MRKDYFENEYIELWIEEGIMHEKFKPEVTKINLQIAKQIVKDRLKFSNEVTMPFFIDLNKVITADKEAREYFAGEESLRFLNASAFYVQNPMALIVTKLFLAFNKPRLRTKLFSDRDEALAWLRNYKN